MTELEKDVQFDSQVEEAKEEHIGEDIKKLSQNSTIFSSFNLQKFLMEFIGSFAIVFFGNWAQIFSDLGLSNQIAVSMTIGLLMAVFTWIGVDVSGAHYNPITTVTIPLTPSSPWFPSKKPTGPPEYCTGSSSSWEA